MDSHGLVKSSGALCPDPGLALISWLKNIVVTKAVIIRREAKPCIDCLAIGRRNQCSFRISEVHFEKIAYIERIVK